MMENNTPANKKNEFLPHLIIIGTFCFLLSQTWLRWGDLVIDTGSALQLPAELLKGKVLYNDVLSLYGFLPPYLIAGLYKLFGISVNTLVYAGIALTLIVSFTVYRIARFFLDQGFSTLLVVNFLFVLAFGNYVTSGIFNFILPYTFAATFFMTFTALSLYFFLKFIFLGNEKNLLIWATLFTAACLCRLESALAVWPAFGLSGFILAAKPQNAGRFKMLAYIISPFLAAALSYCLFFMATHTFHVFQETFMGSIKVVADTPVSKEWSGLKDVPLSLSQTSSSFLLHIAIFFALAMLYRIVNQSGDGNKTSTQTIIPLLAAFLFFMTLKQSSVYEFQYRCLTLILLCGTIAYFSQALSRASTRHSLGLLTLFATSFLVTYRIFLATTSYQYGFSLLTLPLICYYIFFGDIVKSTLENRCKIPEGLLSTAIAVFFMLMIIPFWEHSSGNYKNHDKFVATLKGNLYCNNRKQTDLFWKSVDYLKKNAPQNSTVAVFPEGVGINFFADRPTAFRHYSFLPEDINLFGEDKILSEMKAVKIDYIVILTRETSDFGPTSFGVDYAKKIQKWIDDSYIPIKQFGAKPYASNAVGMLILKKNSKKAWTTTN